MDEVQRDRLSLTVDPRAVPPRPQVPVRQLTLRPAGVAPLDALIATPEECRGVLVYFPGFNTTLGPWEMAKCAHLADVTGLTVVLTEIPGMSRFGAPIPKAVRKDMLAGHRVRTELNSPTSPRPCGTSETLTSCRCSASPPAVLAVGALPVLATWGPIEGLNLVEPVAISRRNLASLQAHNIADLTNASRAGHEHRPRLGDDRPQGQSREPSVRYTPIDLLAIGQVLATEGLLKQLLAADLDRCALVRGARSSLCRQSDFDHLDHMLTRRGVPGPTITVEGLGHQLWHSFPMVVQLTKAMLTPT